MTKVARQRFAGAVLLAAAGAGLAFYWWAPGARAPEPREPTGPSRSAYSASLAPAPVTLAPGLHLLGGLEPSAAYAVETSAGLVLVDTGMRSDAGPLRAQLEALHLDLRQLRSILLTHAHADHSLGARHLRELTGARIYAGRGDCDVLRAGKPREAFFSAFPLPGEAHPTTVDVELAGGEVIASGDVTFHVIATPGHTPGSVCYLMERGPLRALFAGDVITSLTDSGPYSGLGTYSAYLAPRYRGDARAFLASLRELRRLPVPDLVLPGHPRADRTPQSPRLTGPEWHALLDQGIKEMETLLARRAHDGVHFLDGTPQEILPGLYYWGGYGGSALYGVGTPAGRLYLFDAPGGPGLPAFLAGRLRGTGLGDRRPNAVLLTSGGAEANAGLRGLVERWGCAVYAPRAALEEVRRGCPPGANCRAAELAGADLGLPVEVISVAGRGGAAVAYRIEWGGKLVLVSGRIPTVLGEGTAADLVRAWQEPGGDVDAYRRSLERLAGLHPAVWLPAVPVHEQSAYVYGREWEDVLRANRDLADRFSAARGVSATVR